MELSQRFAKLYSGVIYDAMRFDLDLATPFVVDEHIKPAWAMPGGRVLFGPAFTCRGEPVHHRSDIDDTIRIRMFERFFSGCVQVIDTGGNSAVAHFGDVSGKIARKFGCVGAVIDGFTRDLRILEQDRFPVFCRGAQPIDAFGRWQIVSYQEPISLCGPEGAVPVNPGDYIFGDPDGVQVLPGAQVERICMAAEERLQRENMVRRRLAETDDIQALYDQIGRW